LLCALQGRRGKAMNDRWWRASVRNAARTDRIPSLKSFDGDPKLC
jgi:hypothetical protein